MNLMRGKLFIKYVHHKIHFCVESYPLGIKEGYYQYLIDKSKEGFRQTPLVSLRLISLMKLLYEHDYKLSADKGISFMQDDKNFEKKISFFIRYDNNKQHADKIFKELSVLDDKGSIEIEHVHFINYMTGSEVNLRNNGLITVDEQSYSKVTRSIVRFLSRHER